MVGRDTDISREELRRRAAQDTATLDDKAASTQTSVELTQSLEAHQAKAPDTDNGDAAMFKTAGTQAEQSKRNRSDEGSAGGFTRSGAQQTILTSKEEKQKQEEKARSNDALFIQMLDKIGEMEWELAQIREDIQRLEGELIAEYGEDFHEDMAARYLSEEELEKLEGLSPEDRKAAIEKMLADKMLDQNGKVRPEYEGVKIAEYLAQKEAERTAQKNIDKAKAAVDSGDPKLVHTTLEEFDKQEKNQMVRNNVNEKTLEANQAEFAAAKNQFDDTVDAVEDTKSALDQLATLNGLTAG